MLLKGVIGDVSWYVRHVLPSTIYLISFLPDPPPSQFISSFPFPLAKLCFDDILRESYCFVLCQSSLAYTLRDSLMIIDTLYKFRSLARS